MSTVFFVLAIVSVIFGVVFSIFILSFLSRHGIKINYLLLRLYIIKYVQQYRELTLEQDGKPGRLFYAYIFSMILALVFAAIGIALKITVG
jgi:hypothetical protein